MLIGQSSNLFDIDPYILVTASQRVFAIGDVERPANKVSLEVYGDAQIGHKLEDIGNEDSGAMDSTGHAPDQQTADKYKGDLTVNGSATFGRNYYTEEVTQTNSTATSSANTRRSGDSMIATGTTQTPGTSTQVTKKVYYDDVTFYANVTIEGDGTTSMDHLDVGYNMTVGSKFGTNLYSMWDYSWKFMNQEESYSTQKSYSDSDLDASTDPDNFNAINGDLIVNGRTQFVGGTVGIPDGRLVIGARETGTSGSYSVPQGYTRQRHDSRTLMKDYYGLFYGANGSDHNVYNIYNSRFVVEGNSVLFGDLDVLKGFLFTESMIVRDVIPFFYYENGTEKVGYNNDYALEYDSQYKRFISFKPFIFTGENRADRKYNDEWNQTTSSGLVGGVYLQNDFPLKLNSGIYYEGDNHGDGLVISSTNRYNTLNQTERLTNTYRITLKGSTFIEDGPLYVNTSISYTGSNSEGLVFDASSTTNLKNATERPANSKKFTFKSDTYFKDTSLYLQEGSYVRGTMHSNGRIDARCIDLSSFADSSKDSSNSSYSMDASSELGALAARKVILFGTNTTVNGYGSGVGPQAYIHADGSSHFTSIGVGGYLSGSYFDYISMNGANGTLDCRSFKVNAWDTSTHTVLASWTAFSTRSTVENGTTVYKLKLSSTEGEFDDYVKIGYTTLREVEKLNSSSGSGASATLLHFSRGIAPSCIDVTDRTQYEGVASGAVYARNVYLKNSSHETVAKLDDSGYVGATVFQRKNGSNWSTVIDSTGKGFLNGLQSTGMVNVYTDGSTVARLDSTGNVSGVAYQIKNGFSWDTLVDSNAKGYFKGLQSNGNITVTGSISATGNIGCSGEVSGATIATSNSSGMVPITRIDGAGNATLGAVTCGDVTSSGAGSFSTISLERTVLYKPISFDTDYISVDGYCGLNAYQLRTSGVVRIDYDGTVYQSSDIKLKKDIEDFKHSAVEMIESVPVKSFTWKDTDKKVLAGFIAQDMEYIDKTYTDESYKGLVNSSNDTKTISVNGLVPLLWKAVQELSQEVKDLKEALKNGRNQ